MSRIASSGQVRQRDPRIRDKAFLGFVAQLPCVSCVCRGHSQRTRTEVCHVKVSFPEAGWRAFGHSEKSHDKGRTVPLCSECHRTGPAAQHANLGGDERHFWKELAVYPPALCSALVEAYEARADGARVIRHAGLAYFPFPDEA